MHLISQQLTQYLTGDGHSIKHTGMAMCVEAVSSSKKNLCLLTDPRLSQQHHFPLVIVNLA